MSLEVKAQILDRVLSLKDYSPFILICDSLLQTADFLLEEIERRRDSKKTITIIRDLNSEKNVAQKVQQHIKPGSSVIGVFHTDKQLELPPSSSALYAPHGLPLLEYMATTVVKILPNERAVQRCVDSPVTGIFDFSEGLYNQPIFRVEIEHRRKTGRAMTGTFEVDSTNHTLLFKSPQALNEEVLPEGLTTFNLALSDKQKKDRENVALPFLEAQERPDGGGAIVYQFEKDDDYDEEDPYEDPF